MSKDFKTIKKAISVSGISERHIRKYIKAGLIEIKLFGSLQMMDLAKFNNDLSLGKFKNVIVD